MPRGWEIGSKQPCIKWQKNSAIHFVYFWSRKTLTCTHLEATSYIPQQGQSLHIWTTSLSTTGCYKNKYTVLVLRLACISRFAAAILSGEIELALSTIRVKEETDEIGERLEHTPQKSLKRLSQETGVSVSSVQRAKTLLKLHIRIVNIHTFAYWEFLSRHVTNRNNHNHYTYSNNV